MVSHATYLPDDAELETREIKMSTPAMKAAGPYMHLYCEEQAKEFMLCRNEEKDPRKCLREGRELTACGIKFLQQVKKLCRKQFDEYTKCIDYGSDSRMLTAYCRKQARPWNECVYNNFQIAEPAVGYFMRPHVHKTDRPMPAIDARQPRNYEEEASKILVTLPQEKLDNLPKYPKYRTGPNMGPESILVDN